MATINLGLLFIFVRLGWGLPSSVLTVHPQKALVELGGSVRLTCSTDCPGGKVQWEGLDIEQGEVFSNKTHSILTIAKATVSMEGAKFCTGQCRGTSGQKKVDLQVYSFPDALQLDSEPKIMRTGQPARLVCSLSKVYPPGSLTLTWFRGEERLEATKVEDDMEDFEQQLMFYSSVLELPAAAEEATYKCEATLEVETDTFRQSRVAVVNPQTTQVPSATEEATFALVAERMSRVATQESAITEPPATTRGLPLLSTEPSTASPTPEPLPETSSPSPTRNPVAAVQTSSQNSGAGANTMQVPVLTSTETPATSQPPRLTHEPPTTTPVPATASSLATRAAEKPRSSSATTDPSRDPCRAVITPDPTQGSTGGTLRITCLTADCGKDVQVRWVETPVAKSRYRQEEAEGRSTLVVESISLEHQGVYRCVAIASQPRMASLTISIVPNATFSTETAVAIGSTGSLLGVVITGYVARRLWRRRG
ncbi:mucosal addressin cell adhesion molecule 1 [Podarcis raffonei]|uniref:mucosal addressin cell adhesion molecule 1 n=1 Tax=Podarcis raffonei TaxID=65483 RepID=UPI0023292F35|nr:mucosal addressin cell adhesion molecule 1 [Podarcis raffonei]